MNKFLKANIDSSRIKKRKIKRNYWREMSCSPGASDGTLKLMVPFETSQNKIISGYFSNEIINLHRQ